MCLLGERVIANLKTELAAPQNLFSNKNFIIIFNFLISDVQYYNIFFEIVQHITTLFYRRCNLL